MYGHWPGLDGTIYYWGPELQIARDLREQNLAEMYELEARAYGEMPHHSYTPRDYNDHAYEIWHA